MLQAGYETQAAVSPRGQLLQTMAVNPAAAVALPASTRLAALRETR